MKYEIFLDFFLQNDCVVFTSLLAITTTFALYIYCLSFYDACGVDDKRSNRHEVMIHRYMIVVILS